jgi:hypothetical protein
MSRETTFRAPWGRALWIISGAVVAILVAVGGIVTIVLSPDDPEGFVRLLSEARGSRQDSFRS